MFFLAFFVLTPFPNPTEFPFPTNSIQSLFSSFIPWDSQRVSGSPTPGMLDEEPVEDVEESDAGGGDAGVIGGLETGGVEVAARLLP